MPEDSGGKTKVGPEPVRTNSGGSTSSIDLGVTPKRPQLSSPVDDESMERMKAAYLRDVNSGNMAPGARFLDQALSIRSGSGTAMSVNDAATTVHDIARSDGGRAVGKASKSILGGDPAKIVASGATVVQAGAQALDQTDAGRQATYARSKRVYEKSSTDRHMAIEALHAENIHSGEELTDEQRSQRSQTVRNAWKAVGRNLGKGLRTAALAKATGNSGELLTENAMKHTVGKKTDLAEGEVAQESDIVSGSMYGDLKRKITQGRKQKLSVDRKASLEQLTSHQKSLESQAWTEKALRDIGAADTAEAVDDPADSYSFVKEDEDVRASEQGISDLKESAQKERARRAKGGVLGVGATHTLLADEQKKYDEAKSTYDAATSEAKALREAHLQKHTDAYKALHARTTGKMARRLGYSNELSPEETARKKYHHAEMTRLATPHTLDSLQGYMSEEQLAQAGPASRTMRDLESVRDTGLTLNQHDQLNAHKQKLAEIENRKKTGLSRSDQAELEQTKRRIALLYEEQGEHNSAIKENLGKRAGTDGRFGGVDRSDNVDPRTYQRTALGTLAQGTVTAADGLRTGAQILGGSDKDAQAALQSRNFGVAAATGTMGVVHEVGGMVAKATGLPTETKKAVKPVQGLMHGSAEILEGLAGPEAERETGRTVQREFTTQERLRQAAKAPVDWMGSTDHGQPEKDYGSMVHAGVAESDESLAEISPTYAASREKFDDAVSSVKDRATDSFKTITDPAAESLASLVTVPKLPALLPPTESASDKDIKPDYEADHIPAEEPQADTQDTAIDEHDGDSEGDHVDAGDTTTHKDPETDKEADNTPAEEPQADTQDTATDEHDGDSEEEEEEEDDEDDDEWWSEGEAKEKEDEPTVQPSDPQLGKRPILDLGEIQRAGSASALLHRAVGDRAHREGMTLKDKTGGNVSEVHHLGTDLRSQIQAAGMASAASHEADQPETPAVAEVTKNEYNTWGSRFSRFSRNLRLRAGNAFRQSGILGGARSVGRSLWSGIRSLFGGKARNYDDPIENRKREEEARGRRRS